MSYQAIYDATIRQIQHCDPDRILREVANNAFSFHGLDYYCHMVANNIMETHNAPHAVMRPKISIDGNRWCCLYGDNIQDGVAGFGDTPERACAEFDRVWRKGAADEAKAT